MGHEKQLERQQDKIDRQQEKLERKEERCQDPRQQERIDRQQERLERKEEKVQEHLQQDRHEDRKDDRRDDRVERQRDNNDYSRIERREERMQDRGERQRDTVNSGLAFCPGRSNQKIIISPGTGAGWVTWAPKNATDNFLVWMLTYEPLIRAKERRADKDRLEELLRDFHRDARQKFSVERIVCARVNDLAVQDVTGPFEVRERDGAEWVVDVIHPRSGRVIPMGADVY